MLNLPTGWFCILFPDDIRELLIGDESTVICNWVAMHLHRSIFGHSVLIPNDIVCAYADLRDTSPLSRQPASAYAQFCETFRLSRRIRPSKTRCAGK